MPLVLCSVVLCLLPEIQRRKSELFSDLVRHIFQPRIIGVVKMQFSSRNRVNGVHDHVRMDGLCIRVRGDNALAAPKHLFRASLRILLHHERVGMVGSVGREFEVIILSLSVVRIFPEPRRRLPELLGIVLVLKQILHIHEPCLIVARYVGERLPRRCLARRTFQKRHFSFLRARTATCGTPSCTPPRQTKLCPFHRDRSSNFAPLDLGCCLAVLVPQAFHSRRR